MITDPKILTRIAEANAVWNGISVEAIMEKAGEGIAKILKSEFGNTNYTFVAGLGYNGGDALIAARHLVQMIKGDVTLHLIGRSTDLKNDLIKKKWEELKQVETNFPSLKVIQDSYAHNIEKTDVIVEGLIGTGIEGKLYKRFADVALHIRKAKAKCVAIDLPVTGYDPDLVISMHLPKVAGARIVDLGIPSEISDLVGPGEIRELFIPDENAYKTKTGELFVFGGSDTFHGAPIMAVKGASKFIGSVYFYTTPGNRELIKDLKLEVQEFITVSDKDIFKYAEYADAFLFGPGLEDNFMNRALIRELFEAFPDKPKVIDAYAIAMAPHDKLKNCILTPHRGELRHIWGSETNLKTKRLEGNLRRFAQENGCIVVLKGHVDLIFFPDGRVKFNKTGNPGMAKGGTGDILSGIVGAFLTKNDLELAASAGTFLNGYAGDLAYEKFGYNYSATDIIPFAQIGFKNCMDLKI